MIWGKTYKARDKKYYGTKKWFAWRPVILDDGSWAWWIWVTQTHDDNTGVFFHHKYTLPKTTKGFS